MLPDISYTGNDRYVENITCLTFMFDVHVYGFVSTISPYELQIMPFFPTTMKRKNMIYF